MIFYKTYFGKIKRIEVERENKSYVWVKDVFWGENRISCYRKKNGYENYFKTWKEAHEHITAEAREKVESVRRPLAYLLIKLGCLENELVKIEGMKDHG